jgi:predicted dehydrogenase
MTFRMLVFVLTLPLLGQDYKIAVVGLVHSHVWGHIGKVIKGDQAKLVGIAETVPELLAEAKQRGAAGTPIYSDYVKMLDETKPDIVWSFVENNRHLDIVKACAPRKINVIFEKPLASTYKDALEIQSLARKNNIQILTNYQMAWWPSNYAAKAEVENGAIGRMWRLRGIVGHGGPGGATGLNKWFFNWLTDPEKNDAGALMDFGCYNALWSLWYLGKPESVYAQVNQLRPETFPKVEDNSTMILHYKNGVGIFEGSWDLPDGYQDLEVFGLGGSVYMKNGSVELRKSKQKPQAVELQPLPPERSEPLAMMVHSLKSGKPIDGLTAVDINVEVIRIIDMAKESVRTGGAVKWK